MEWLPSGWKFIVPLKVVSWSLFFPIYYCIKSFHNGIVEHVANWFYLNSRVGILFFWGRWMPRQQCFWVRRVQFSESPWVRFLQAHMQEKTKLFARLTTTVFCRTVGVGMFFYRYCKKGSINEWHRSICVAQMACLLNKYNTSVAESTITDGQSSLYWKATA